MTIFEEVEALARGVHAAAPAIAARSDEERNRLLIRMADKLTERTDNILRANEEDLANAAQNGVPTVMIDRLRLTADRIKGVADAMRELCTLPSPLGVKEQFTRPSGITVTAMQVPIGVVAIIYEARPNVTADAAALCLKSGNAVILRGGKEAITTNRALVAAMREALEEAGLPPLCIGLIECTDRESARALMQMRGLVDVLIPRGSKGLIRSCVDNARIPVIETGAGNCHVYVDKSADIKKALSVCINAKCQRPSVCNAAETLLLHRDIAPAFLPAFFEATREWNLELRGCDRARAVLPSIALATEEDFATEYNDYIMAVRVVDSTDEAIAHVNRYGTGHIEEILTDDKESADLFLQLVDAAAVYHNASTRFTDGGEFGFGAEIGISTQKLHARGPMGLPALTTVKYVVTGDGAIRK